MDPKAAAARSLEIRREKRAKRIMFTQEKVDLGWSFKAIADALKVNPRTVSKYSKVEHHEAKD